MHNLEISLPCGNISSNKELGRYFQDLSQAIYHFDHNSFGEFDEDGIPFLIEKGKKTYSVIYVIQYALIQNELIMINDDVKSRKTNIKKCIDWLDKKSEKFKSAIVWRNEENQQYNLKKGWISGMYQGQAISLYLRAYQIFGDEKYLNTSKNIFKYFHLDFSEGGVTRLDENGDLWIEEYPTTPPSFVLNGFIYAAFGILDLYRVTKSKEAKAMFDACVKTLEGNLHKYDLWYWSVYDQGKEQLVSYYYLKNVHIPLMDILFKLTKKKIFEKYNQKWQRQLDSKTLYFITKIMYRLQPRLKKVKSILKNQNV